MFALGNEIPPGVVRWHGRVRVERFLRGLYEEAKARVARQPVHLRQLPADRVPRPLVLRRLRVQRLPAPRGASCARTSRGCSTSPGTSRCCSPRRAPTASARARRARPRSPRCTCARRSRKARAARSRSRGPTSGGAAAIRSRTGRSASSIASASRSRRRPPSPRRSRTRRFPRRPRAAWPRVSVVVCAYNAADTLEDCLTSLERLTYPDYEIILVNDGSRDRTGDIGRAHPRVQVIDIPNGGLSAARNVGLARGDGRDRRLHRRRHARRSRLADVPRPAVPDLGRRRLGRPQRRAARRSADGAVRSRARPAAPTHVLLDDRIAEHVPGCNMAFRRDALLAIGGFNPIYLRAGDDVDVCWRLQARGWKIGFASAALVWHHHRATVKAYWRQQVGYGEGETWLMAHHPEKFLDGNMLWRGRIYSPLPFVRSLWGTKINAGVWGTAAFPSVYRTDVHPFAFLPHSIRWQVISFVLTLVGRRRGGDAAATTGRRRCCSARGSSGWRSTVAKNLAYAMRSDVDSLPRQPPLVPRDGRVPPLHPAARAAARADPRRAVAAGGRAAALRAADQPRAEPVVPRGVARAAAHLGQRHRRSLLERAWTTADRVLGEITDWLRRSRAVRTIEIDEGWADDRDVSVLVGRWAWVDVRALVEDHGAGRGLLRVSTHLRPTTLGVVSAVALGVALLVAASAGVALRWPRARRRRGAPRRARRRRRRRGARRRRRPSCGAASSGSRSARAWCR